jgi:EAL domain-containing protein (putative c-di-GMP-specific phosphodiesterase class I)
MALEADLRAAFEKHEFVLHYQPQVDLRSLKISGVEALLRWHHPTRGLVPPGVFVSVAEECGLIHAITCWVLEQACAQNAAWRKAGWPDCRIAVNVSTADFKYDDMYQTISDVLARTQLPPQLLELEVTETLLLQPESMIKAVPALKELGVMLAIDDFGTGYSSLNYLRRLPVHKLKIDKSFVCGLPTSQDDAIIAKAIIDLGHGLGHSVLAEGIENEAQLAFLRDHGCDEGQGYFFGRPVPADAFEEIWKPENNRQLVQPGCR